jgi:predicted dehydrogenase
MKKVIIIGGEIHISEVTRLAGKELEIVGAAVREDLKAWAAREFACPVVTDYRELIERYSPDIAAVSNENNKKEQVITRCLKSGLDVIADKPLCLTLEEHKKIESVLQEHPERRLLNLLTLRGVPHWRGLKKLVKDGTIGEPAFMHVRMAVQLKPDKRPPWFLDYRFAGGPILDLLIHGLDQVEWVTGSAVRSAAAVMGNLSNPEDKHLLDHAAVFCKLEYGGSAVVEGQRMLPGTKGSDYRVHVTGTGGYADLDHSAKKVTYTNAVAANAAYVPLPDTVSVASDWLKGGDLIPQEVSLRANRLALMATEAAKSGRIELV